MGDLSSPYCCCCTTMIVYRPRLLCSRLQNLLSRQELAGNYYTRKTMKTSNLTRPPNPPTPQWCWQGGGRQKALKSNAFLMVLRKSIEKPTLFHRWFEKAWSFDKSWSNQWCPMGFSNRGVNEKSIEKPMFQRSSPPPPSQFSKIDWNVNS